MQFLEIQAKGRGMLSESESNGCQEWQVGTIYWMTWNNRTPRPDGCDGSIEFSCDNSVWLWQIRSPLCCPKRPCRGVKARQFFVLILFLFCFSLHFPESMRPKSNNLRVILPQYTHLCTGHHFVYLFILITVASEIESKNHT